MSKWADMAKAVVEAEFPDFLVVTAFSVFALADEEKAVAEVAVNQTHCQRLAKLFSVDAQALACQIARHRPTAQAIKSEPRSSLHNVAPGQGTLPGTPGGTRGPRGCRQQRQALILVGWRGGAAL